MTLFPASILKQKARPPGRDKRVRSRIPTGVPRLVESSSDREARAAIETWAALLDAVRRSSSSRLMLLERRPGRDRIACPWEQLTGCDVTCRCGGAGTVTVEFLRTHYEHLAVEIATIARPALVLLVVAGRSCS